VKNTTFEQTVSTSKGFYIKQANKGYSEGKWVLPSVHAGGKLTVNAASGISADIKAKNGQALQGAITALAALPGTEWLKGLNSRSDVQWNTVKDAYDSWNYKSQSLNPAVAAVIAIAAAAATAGSSLAATVASSVTSTVGGGAVTTGAVTAGMSSLAAQAAVALVENQGNLSKTLSALGSSSSVKSLATSMVIGGALAGFDKVMNIDVPPDKARLPALVKNEGWGKIVQRVAGQSVISSGLNTAINGGSFKDNLTNALLANIGNQINAEGAGLIGDNGEVLGIPGKSLSHAVVAGISAEIGRGDGKGAAAGALAAELAGVVMQSSLFEPANLNERERQLLRLQEALNGNEAKSRRLA
jgi:filamentous hemagglutinin